MLRFGRKWTASDGPIGLHIETSMLVFEIGRILTGPIEMSISFRKVNMFGGFCIA